MHKGKTMLQLSQQKIEHHIWVGSYLALCSGGHIRIWPRVWLSCEIFMVLSPSNKMQW